jgi:hypothetical protein
MAKKEMPTMGKVVIESGKVVLDTGLEKFTLPAGAVSKEDLKGLDGQKVELIYSEPQRMIVAFRPPRKKPILCYLPAAIRPPVSCYIVARPQDTFLEEFAVKVRQDLIDKLVADKYLASDIANQLIKKKKILCYVPKPDFLTKVQEDIRVQIAKQLVDEGVISKKVYEQII